MAQSLPSDQMAIIAAQHIGIWESHPRPYLSLEVNIYKNYFSYLTPVRVIKDSNSEETLWVIVDRNKAIETVKRENDLYKGVDDGT